MLRDENLFPRMEGLRDFVAEGEGTREEDERDRDREYRNDELDDVFGSEPGSPAEHDIGEGGGRGAVTGNSEYSDIPRMKEKHEKEGYRDGVTEGKKQSVQVGFDEGYSLGAMLGLKVGKIVGLIEGIWRAIGQAEGAEWEVEKKRMEKLYSEATKELSTKGVFGREYWGEDGIWTFVVPGDEEKDVTFEDVVKAHPLVRKWEAVIEEEVKKWRLDLNIMDGEHDGADEEVEAGSTVTGKGAVATRKAAEEPAAPPGKIMGIPKSELNW